MRGSKTVKFCSNQIWMQDEEKLQHMKCYEKSLPFFPSVQRRNTYYPSPSWGSSSPNHGLTPAQTMSDMNSPCVSASLNKLAVILQLIVRLWFSKKCLLIVPSANRGVSPHSELLLCMPQYHRCLPRHLVCEYGSASDSTVMCMCAYPSFHLHRQNKAHRAFTYDLSLTYELLIVLQ